MTDPASVLDCLPKYSRTTCLFRPELPPTAFASYPLENRNRVLENSRV